jgi:hypothetical protein
MFRVEAPGLSANGFKTPPPAPAVDSKRALIVLEKVLTHGARDVYTPADCDTSFERQTAHFALLDMIKKLIGRALRFTWPARLASRL